MAKETGWLGILLRVVAGVVLVLVTVNPLGWSYHHWAMSDVRDFGPAKAIAGALLLGGWVLYVRAAFHALGVLGVGLMALGCAAVVWLLSDWGLLDPSQPRALAWILLVSLGLVLGVGLAWSILRRRLTGQVDIEGGPES
jgi:hypothetical protein